MPESITVQVAYALPESAYCSSVCLPEGSCVADALAACDVNQVFPQLELDRMAVGVHGRKVERNRLLHDGDRVEIYRPLQLDPMEARRRRAHRTKH
jgi:putative ubiquitin-RnfH superfamily antitoxin RatB of RatAB toxin-antitoxin module